jgi:hypothetical protein
MCSRPAWPIGQDYSELVAADPAWDVGGANHLAHPLGGLREHRVARQMPDLVVHVLEVVEVEDDQSEAPVVAVCARTLARQRLVEVPPVVEPGQRVEIGELPCLAEALCVLDRRRRPLGQLLEAAHVVLREMPVAVPCVDREVADPAAVVLEWHGETSGDQARRVLVLLAIAVGDLDRPCARPVWGARDRLCPVRGQAVCGDGRDALLVLQADQGRIDPFHPGTRLERPRQHLVHVDRAGDLAQEPASTAFLLGPLDRPGELGRELVHALLEGLDDRAHAVVGPPAQPPACQREQDEQKQDQAAERRRDDDE